MLEIIKNCTKTAKQLYDEIVLEEKINNDRDSGKDDVLQQYDHDDNSATSSKDISVT